MEHCTSVHTNVCSNVLITRSASVNTLPFYVMLVQFAIHVFNDKIENFSNLGGYLFNFVDLEVADFLVHQGGDVALAEVGGDVFS